MSKPSVGLANISLAGPSRGTLAIVGGSRRGGGRRGRGGGRRPIGRLRRQNGHRTHHGVRAQRPGAVAHVVGEVVGQHENEAAVAGRHVHGGPAVVAHGHQPDAGRMEREVDVPRPYLVLGGPPEVHVADRVRAEHRDAVRLAAHLDHGRPGGRGALVDVLQVHRVHAAAGHERDVERGAPVVRAQQHHEHDVARGAGRRRPFREVDGPLDARVRVEHQHRAAARVRHERVVAAVRGPRLERHQVLQTQRVPAVSASAEPLGLDLERPVRRLWEYTQHVAIREHGRDDRGRRLRGDPLTARDTIL